MGGTLLLVDDLPHAQGPERLAALVGSLAGLARSARVPTVVVLSGTSHAGKGGEVAEAVRQAMEDSGAAHLAFNPIPDGQMAKALERVLDLSGFAMEGAEVDAAVQAAGGDLRSAINMVENLCLGRKPRAGGGGALRAHKRRRKGKSSDKHPLSQNALEATRRAATGARDNSLGLFHALGKFLYNKRAADTVQESSGAHAMTLLPEYERGVMECNPEAVLVDSHLGAEGVVSFIHENYVDFLHTYHVEEAAPAMAALSDAAVLLEARERRSLGGGETHDDYISGDIPRVCEACAGSVAARGFMFANVEKAPRRWFQFRGPSTSVLWKVLQHNSVELQRAKARAGAKHHVYATMSACSYSETVLPAVEDLYRKLRTPQVKSRLDCFLTPDLKGMGGKKLGAAVHPGSWRAPNVGFGGSPSRGALGGRVGAALAGPAFLEDAIEEV